MACSWWGPSPSMQLVLGLSPDPAGVLRTLFFSTLPSSFGRFFSHLPHQPCESVRVIVHHLLGLTKGPFILHRNCVAVPIYRLLSAANHCIRIRSILWMCSSRFSWFYAQEIGYCCLQCWRPVLAGLETNFNWSWFWSWTQMSTTLLWTWSWALMTWGLGIGPCQDQQMWPILWK